MANIEHRGGKKWRLTKDYKGKRYRITIEDNERPSKEMADRLLDQIIKADSENKHLQNRGRFQMYYNNKFRDDYSPTLNIICDKYGEEAADLCEEAIVKIVKKWLFEAQDFYKDVYQWADWLLHDEDGLAQKRKALDDFVADLIDFGKPVRREDKGSYVYYLLNQDKDKVKIGLSDCPEQRQKQLQTGNGEALELVKTIYFETRHEAITAENFLHSYFHYYRKIPYVTKRFRSTEWFDAEILPELLEAFGTREQIFEALDSRNNRASEILQKAFEGGAND